MCSTARIASRFSVIDTGSPAARSSCTKPWRTSSSVPARRRTGPRAALRVIGVVRASRSAGHRQPRPRRRVSTQLLARLGDVGLVLEQHVQRLADHLGSIVVVTEVEQRAGPVDRLGDRRRLLQVERADRAHDLRDLLGERVVDLGHADPHDLLLALEVGVVDVQVEAAPLQRLGELTGVVRREEHDRALRARRSCRARGSTPGSRRAPRAAAPRSRSRRGRPRR